MSDDWLDGNDEQPAEPEPFNLYGLTEEEWQRFCWQRSRAVEAKNLEEKRHD